MEDKEKCPYCGNEEFVLGKQEDYGANCDDLGFFKKNRLL